MKSRLVSLTGATGFLGAHISAAFLRAGWHVRAVVRPGRADAVATPVEVCEAPLERGSLERVFAGSDAVVHAAGLTGGRARALASTNVTGTQAVVEAAAECRTRLIHLSSQAAMGPGTIVRPTREDDPPQPVNAYGHSKLQGEALVRASGGRWVILRPSAVYGPGDRQFLPLVRLAARGVFPLVGRPDLAVTLVYAEDVARATLLAAERNDLHGEAFFVGHGQPQTAERVLAAIAELVGRPYRPRAIPAAFVRLLASLGDISWRLGRRPVIDSARVAELTAAGFVCAVDRARDRLGFSADVAFSDGLARTVQWYRERGWL